MPSSRNDDSRSTKALKSTGQCSFPFRLAPEIALDNSKSSIIAKDPCLSVKVCDEGDASYPCNTRSPIRIVSYPWTVSQNVLEDCSCFQARVLQCGYQAVGVIWCRFANPFIYLFISFEIPVAKAWIYQNSRARNSLYVPWAMEWLISRSKWEA
jgi:hypothetical protein